MTRTALFLSLLLALGTGAAAQTVTVATFNAEFLTRPRVHVKFDLPFRLNATQSEQWTAAFRDQRFNEAAREVAQVLAGIDADVVALTEVGDPTDVAELVAEIAALGVDYPHTAVCDCTDSFTQQHVAVLSRFPLSSVLTAIPGREHYWEELDDEESENDTGISKGMRVTFAAHGENFHLYVVHLASESGGHEQDQQRIAQASLVRRHYLPALTAGEHVIVAGDLNDRRGQPALKRIRGLDDLWGDLIQTGHVDHFADGTEDTRWTYVFQGRRQQIDHILLSHSIDDEWRPGTATVGGISALASDHRPLVVTLSRR